MLFGLRRQLLVALLSGMQVALAGCNAVMTTNITSEASSPYNYRLAGIDPFNKQLDDVFACMKATGALENQGFAIGPFSNGTGKANSATEGGTGSFLPNGPNFAIYAVEAISRAGGIPYDYANTDIVRNIAFVGGENAARHLQNLQNQNMPNFGLSVFATALDFSGADTADIRIGGIGPLYMKTKANAYYAAHVFQPGSQRSLARGFAVFQADYTETGIGVSRFFGGGAGTLITGSASSGIQQPLQRPSAEGVMVSVAFALMEIPALASCRRTLVPFSSLKKKRQRQQTGSTGTSGLPSPSAPQNADTRLGQIY